jgi:GT2 family glycosyltransferase/glycosyltransferase involved in cell wall biosynthesis
MRTVGTACMDIETLHYLWTPDLDPLFWRRGRTGVLSAWYGHVPFAHWIVAAVKPRTVVELGTHNGVSYSAFCEAVVCNGLDTRCFAVDTWQGDEQAGYYGEEVYRDLRRFHDDRYSAFSELLRCTFDDALPYISDGSVDLLHIDGLHTYEAVRHDFENWQRKLSDSAVVLFHDTNVRQGDFGVWRLWEELRTQYPSFEFLHGHGLGVLAIGRSLPTQLSALCSLRDPECVHTIRQRFSLLGERWTALDPRETHPEEIAARDARIVSLEAEIAARDARIVSLEAETTARDSRISSLEAEAARQSATEVHLRARARQRTAQARAEAANAMGRVAEAKAQATVTPLAVRPKIRLLYISGEPDTPGNLYRVVRYVEAAIAAGAQASWIRVDEVSEYSKQIANIDILIIWRVPWDERVADAVAAARSAGARVVFDVDDLMVDPEIARLDVIDGIRTQGLTEQQVRDHYARIHTTMVAADYCTAPTEELATNIRRFLRPALVLSNGFDRASYKNSRRAARVHRSEKSDGLVRIGYAGGSRTHQRDFAVVADAVARVLRDRQHCRLVLFRSTDGKVPILDIAEFPAFQGIEDRIEWHNFVPLHELPEKISHFDINIAPVEVGNVFCEAKSELKFFEAALVDVPTIASPTGPYRQAIRHGMTGFLANSSEDWYTLLVRLVDDPALRHRVARTAHNDVLWRYGPLRRADAMVSALPLLRGEGHASVRAFELELRRGQASKPPSIRIPETEIVFEADKFGDAEVAVVVPLYNYAQYIEESLESIRTQTLEPLDLIVVDDASTDASLSVAVSWAQRHAKRFNRIAVLRNKANAGLGSTRNAAFDAADTPFVLPLDADNRLLPECTAVCLSTITNSGAAFVYPKIRQFGDASDLMGNDPFEPGRFIGWNYIDAMALVSKEAWAAVGGYGEFRMGWEDYDFWCRLIENGLWGCPASSAPLAEYRVHGSSMIRMTTLTGRNAPELIADLERRHRWLNIVFPPRTAKNVLTVASASPRLEKLLPILRCPETGNALEYASDGSLRTVDGARRWPLVAGCPNLFPDLDSPEIVPESHLSNPLPASVLTLIDETRGGLVLNLSAGGTVKRFDNVVEAEAAVFRHTDLLADAHRLPFVDGAFDAVIVLNAFEHYREPKRVARELFRVLRPGGKLLIRTAFLQPLHERPWHFYNCTRYGLEEWFKDFETEELHVSENFSPGHSISWLASEAELALRRDLSSNAADAFADASLGHFISLWRSGEEARLIDPIWSALAQLPQETQESIAAGFEYVGRRPLN